MTGSGKHEASAPDKQPRRPHQEAEDRYQAPFSRAQQSPAKAKAKAEDPLSEPELEEEPASGQDALTSSSPYFDDKEAREAMAYIQEQQQKRQDGDDAGQGSITIQTRPRRDSQVGDYEGGGSIFDGPSAGAIPSSMSSMRHMHARPGLLARSSSRSARRRISREFSPESPFQRTRKSSIDSVNSQAISLGEPALDDDEPQPSTSYSARPGIGRGDSFRSTASSQFGRKRRIERRESTDTQHRGLLGGIIGSWRGEQEQVNQDPGSDDESDGYGLNDDEDEDDDDLRSNSSSEGGYEDRRHDLLPSAFGAPGGDPVFGESHIENVLHVEQQIPSADVESQQLLPRVAAAADPAQAAKARDDLTYLDKSSRSRQQVYLAEEDTLIRLTGYSTVTARRLLYITACTLSLGIFYLLGRWLPRLRLRWVCRETPFEQAEFVLIENQWGDLHAENIVSVPFARPLATVFPPHTSRDPPVSQAEFAAFQATRSKNASAASSIRREQPAPFAAVETEQLMDLTYIDYRYTRFALHPPSGRFRMIKDWRDPNWLSVSAVNNGVSWDAEKDRKALFGANVIDIAAKSTWSLLVDEVLHPFYMFQIVSIALWSFDNYYYYAFCIALISIASILTTLIETKSTIKRMREMSRFTCEVRVLREGQWSLRDSSELVPGDVYDVAESGLLLFPADSILLTGDAIVNESMLTGESVPVSKIPITDAQMSALQAPGTEISPELARHFLFSGTRIIRIRGANGLVPDGPDSGAKAMVVRTGFDTTKGALVRSMLFPKPMGFKFYRDSFRFIGFLAGIAGVGFLVSAANFIQIGIAWHTIVVRALDLITVVVPPALPATMSIGTTFAISRLRKNGIFCISPNRVNIGGKVNVFCFDKTGTLTADGLDVLGTRTIDGRAKRFSELHESIDEMPHSVATKDDAEARKLPLLYALATCHSLKVVDGEVIGDPLDVKMFEYTGWTLDEGKDRMAKATTKTGTAKDGKSRLTERPPALVQTVVRPPGGQAFDVEDALKPGRHAHFLELGVLRTFDFVSQLRRMSVVVKRLKSDSMEVFVKGAPEVMSDICLPESFPSDYDDLLAYYTKHGYRVIACAGKSIKGMSWIKAQRLRREQAESGLRFLGLIIFENKIKEGTPPAIDALRQANIVVKMATGDNPRTAISVARECGMVGQSTQVYLPNFLRGNGKSPDAALEWFNVDDERLKLDPYSLKPLEVDPHLYDYEEFDMQDHELALTGEVFRWMIDYAPLETLRRMLIKGTIFARMSPDEKHELVERLQALGYTVGMCGDGANDCGALKAADIGISLSEAEASVAAPFTSRSPDISCVIEVIREGRAALVTSFSCFKFMALYSLIQFTSITILYSFASSLGDFQFLYIDLFIILPVAIAMARTLPYSSIHPKRPTANLVSKKVLISMIGQVFVCSGAQILTFYLTRAQDWYTPPVMDPDELNVVNPENSALFLVSSFQYILVAAVFSVGPPYRKPMYTNPLLIFFLVTLSAFSLYCLFATSGFVFDLLGLVSFPTTFHWLLFAIVAANTVLSFLFESYAAKPVIKGIKACQRVYARARYGKAWKEERMSARLHAAQAGANGANGSAAAATRNHDSKLYKAVAAGMARDGQA